MENNQSLLKQMIACGICAGTVATFGSPIGEVIFAIEVTSTFYMVGTL
jgi:H+/Cl- antiporter ClcA